MEQQIPASVAKLPVATILPGLQARMSTENFGRLFSNLPQLTGSGFSSAVTRLGALNGLALNGTPANGHAVIHVSATLHACPY